MNHILALRCLAAGVMRHVELVVQVVGYTKIPLVPKKGPDLITWYQKVRGCAFCVCTMSSHLMKHQHSLVIVPHDHVIRHEGKILKRHGRLVFAGEITNVSLCINVQPFFFSHQRGTKACEAHATSTTPDSSTCPQHPCRQCSS